MSAGTLNVGGPVRARVVDVGGATLLSGIVALLQRAQTQKPALAQAANQAAARFLQAVLAVSAVVCALWLAFEPSRAFEATLAVLVVACPCAFAIAMPAALAAATGDLARHGILVTRPDIIESLAKLDCVIFDKTGTLTRGELRVESVDVQGSMSASDCEQIAAALERESEHPIARAFETTRSSRVASQVGIVAGAGIEGEVDGKRYRLGTHAFAAELSGAALPVASIWDAGTRITLADEREVLAHFILCDTVRAESHKIARELHSLGIDAEILSGDGLGTVTAVAQQCRIERFEARCSPEQKLQRVRELQAQGSHIAMLGDGINDAPVLGAADVSIAMGKGAALAHATADLILIRENLSALPHAIRAARRTLRIAKQNLYWAAAYNFGSLPLAALGFIPPWLAALGMSASSVAVILNATRLLRARKGPGTWGLGSGGRTSCLRPHSPGPTPQTLSEVSP